MAPAETKNGEKMAMAIKHNLYGGCDLDRAHLLRKDEARIEASLRAPTTKLLPLWRSLSLIDSTETAAPRLSELTVAEAADLSALPGAETALLGFAGGSAYFALDLTRALTVPDSQPLLAERGSFVELRSVGALLPAREAALAAYARGLMWWHQRHRFCGVCGHATSPREGGHVRACTNAGCATLHFPRTDPAVIMLVHDGDRCLLGRQPRFAPGLYSTLAGFVEPGESLEEAVAREVFEEVGVRVAEVSYASSQPWPFPSSLMLGFYARAASSEITVQADEIEHARWFTREELLTTPPGLPRADSISRRLIENWLGR